MDWSWGIQLLLACGLLFVLVGVLWPKLKPEDSVAPRPEPVPILPTRVLPSPKPHLRYAEQVHRSYKKLFGRWLRQPDTASRANEPEINQRKAA